MRCKAALIPAVLLLCLGALTPSPSPAPALTDFLRTLRLPGESSEAFITPAEGDLRAFATVVEKLLAGHAAEAASLAAPLNYEILQLTEYPPDPANLPATPPDAVLYLVARERPEGFRGQGTFLFNPHFQSNLVVEVPHPLFDSGTLEEGGRLFQETGARGLFIAGTHRCANKAVTPCRTGKTAVCGGVYRISDVAHNTANFFHAAHRATLQAVDPPVVLSLHAYRQQPNEPDIVLSDGTRRQAPPSARVNRLRDALIRAGVKAASCNSEVQDPSEDRKIGRRKRKPSRPTSDVRRPTISGGHRLLCGETNVQGRLSNGAGNACLERANTASGLFLHAEQGRFLLQDPHPLIEAVQALFRPL